MDQSEQIDNALQLGDLELPSKPQVTDVRWEFYEDSVGDPSLRVWVIFSDETADDEISGNAVQKIKRAIIDRLRANNVNLFPYFSYARANEPHSAPVKK